MLETTASNSLHASQPSNITRESTSMTPASAGAISFRSDIFGGMSNNGNGNGLNNSSFGPLSNVRHPTERPIGMHSAHSSSFNDTPPFSHAETRPAPAILIRKLSKTTSAEALASMLLFATDLIDTEFIQSPYPDADYNYATAVARFLSHTSATEAQQKLNGKPNTTRDASLVVEVYAGGLGGMGGMNGSWDRRATIDGSILRGSTSATSSSNGSFSGTGGRSRFNSTFHSNEKYSPPLSTSNGSGDFVNPEINTHLQSLFSPQSPLGNSFEDRVRVTGKSMINDDGADEETGELLKDPVAYAKNGQQGRRLTQPQQQIPIPHFVDLAISTNVGSNGMGSGLSTPRGGTHSQISPTSLNGGQHNNKYAVNSFPRPQYPPVNPADQNPPCNTLYVGNLPLETSEDELKALFSKQKGYRRLCFRTKANGPMCFVEFDDIMMATRTLSELYGSPLHNSTKGGIRLSFSKNPLGVRSSQNNNHATASPALPSSYNHFVSGKPNFSSVSGPPPGLSVPMGMSNGIGGGNSNNGNAMFSNSANTTPNGQHTPNGYHPMFANNLWATGMHLSDLGPGGLRHAGLVAAQASGNWMNRSPTGLSDHQSFRR